MMCACSPLRFERRTRIAAVHASGWCTYIPAGHKPTPSQQEIKHVAPRKQSPTTVGWKVSSQRTDATRRINVPATMPPTSRAGGTTTTGISSPRANHAAARFARQQRDRHPSRRHGAQSRGEDADEVLAQEVTVAWSGLLFQ